MNKLTEFLQSSLPLYFEDLAALVGIDCGSEDKAGVDQIADWIERRCGVWKWQSTRIKQERYGDQLLTKLSGSGQGRVLLLGHMDTVYPHGTVAERPLRREGTRLLGPGVGDMKGGLLAGMYALRALQTLALESFGELLFFFCSDEEIGSPSSQKHYLEAAQNVDAVLVVEGARENGDIVSARKGVRAYTITVTGRKSHAGIEPEKGANAILQLAHLICEVHKFHRVRPGISANAGVIRGGSKTNVVPDFAQVEIDTRAANAEEAAYLHRLMQELVSKITVSGTSITLTAEDAVLPMAKTPAIAELARFAKQAASEIGFGVVDVATGGVSDANAIGALGIPVLDGLGPITGDDHSPAEWLDTESVLPRTAMLARLIQLICKNSRGRLE